jgi:hypothetical protein
VSALVVSIVVTGSPVVGASSVEVATTGVGAGVGARGADEEIELEQAETVYVTASNTVVIRRLLIASGCLTLKPQSTTPIGACVPTPGWSLFSGIDWSLRCRNAGSAEPRFATAMTS